MSKNETGMTLSLSHLEPLGVTFSLSIDRGIADRIQKFQFGFSPDFSSVFFRGKKAKERTFFGQTSTQAPQEMHSGDAIFSSLTILFTSRLMGQFFVQSLQSMHFSLSASR